MSLQIKNLSIAYQSPVVTNFSLEIHPGEITVLLGPSGSGKSSLLNAMNGVIPQMKKAKISGEIWVDGTNCTHVSVGERSKIIGSVFQNPREQILFPTVEEELLFPMENLHFEHDRIENQLEKSLSRLEMLGDTHTHTLSGGEQQRLITETTLVMGQKYILFDEPLAHLDARQANDLMERISNLAKAGYGIFLVEHRRDVVLPYAHHVIDWSQAHTKNIFPSLEVFPLGKVIFQGEDVGVQRGKKTIFSHLNFTIHEGESIQISGENGAGKTTLFHLLAGQIKPSSGKLEKSDENIAWVMQNPDYQLFMSSVKDEVFLQAVDEVYAKELLSHFHLDELENRHPLSLSEGQKRKVGTAAMLAKEPDVLLLDEPTVGLDDESMNQILTAISHFQQKQKEKGKRITILTISHDARIGNFFGTKKIQL